jgi:cysteine desulfurase/selenocysteine lyase
VLLPLNVEGVHPHDVATILDADAVCVRAGHHCAQPLMKHLGITACARATFAIYNTKEDVDALIESLKKVRKWLGYGA